MRRGLLDTGVSAAAVASTAPPFAFAAAVNGVEITISLHVPVPTVGIAIPSRLAMD